MIGRDGVVAPMMKHFLQSMITGDLEQHVSQSKLADQPILRMRIVKGRYAV
jgi:putative transposase